MVILTHGYRPCYDTLVPKKIRGRYRVFLHLCIEGKPVPKFDKHSNPRHHYGKGQIGADIGTQTVAYTSESSVGLKNLAERGKRSIKNSERMERIYLRKMDRSKRAMNPQNYNADGTIKKGKKTWRYSKNYVLLHKVVLLLSHRLARGSRQFRSDLLFCRDVPISCRIFCDDISSTV